MAYHIEKGTGDLVIDGWENGIATSPHKGIGDLKCLNLTTLQGEVSVNYNRIQQSQTPIASGTITASGVDNTLLYTGSTPLVPGMWVSVASGSSITNFTSSTGFASGSGFYVLTVSGVDVTFALSYNGTLITNFGLTGSATFSTVNMGKLIDYGYTSSHLFPGYQYFVLDANGLVWEFDRENGTGSTTWTALQPTVGGDGIPATGIFCFGSYVIVASDYLWVKGLTTQGTPWAKFTGTIVPQMNFSGPSFSHASVTIPSGWVIICDGNFLDTLAPVAGKTFSPSDETTYSWNGSVGAAAGSVNYAVQTNNNQEVFTCIAMIGNGSAATGGSGGSTNVLVGGLGNIIYPWAPGTAFFQPVMFLSENYTQTMVTVNNLVFIFPGAKGNIYVTNGTSLTSIISVPDYIANNIGTNQDPYFIWGGAMYLRGRIWFSVQAPNCGGVWSFVPTINYFVQQDTGVTLRLEHQNSYGNYNGMASILFSPQQTTDADADGVQYWSGWTDGTGTNFGMDYSGTTPYTNNNAAIIETDLIPTGTMLREQTFSQIEYKLSAPLVTGETVTIYWRTNLTTAFASTGADMQLNPAKTSGYFVPDFEFTQWLQLQVILVSTASSPSYCKLKELRIR